MLMPDVWTSTLRRAGMSWRFVWQVVSRAASREWRCGCQRHGVRADGLRGSRSRPAPLTWVISMAGWQA
jgi:hypothetical protein